MKKELKLFIWENVLCDYTCGMVVILAYDLEHAKSVFEEKYPDKEYILEDFFGSEHKTIIEPNAFYLYGGD